MIKALRGRVIAEIISENEKTSSGGILIINRTAVSLRAKVLGVGADSVHRNGSPLKSPAKTGDIVHFKKYTPMAHRQDREGYKEGKVTIWWDDIVAVEEG